MGVYATDYQFLSNEDLLYKSVSMNHLLEESLNLHMQLNESINSELNVSSGMFIDEILNKLREKTRTHSDFIANAKTTVQTQTVVYENDLNKMNIQRINIYYEIIEKVKSG
ncbi:hypothetical protein [Rummeliibacillus pycnus]|uniref:hypothetical protein n=1 Tax=Rummeliibacillus pycnus TaxID=101070 RepID=UPI0037C7474D